MANSDDQEMGSVPNHQSYEELSRDASGLGELDERAAKRLKSDNPVIKVPAAVSEVPGEGLHDAPKDVSQDLKDTQEQRTKGLAPIKKEFLIDPSTLKNGRDGDDRPYLDDDAAEGRDAGNQQQDRIDDRDRPKRAKKDKKKHKGQNIERSFGHFGDAIRLCNSRAYYPELSPRECRFGDKCKLCHDIRKYLEDGRREDVESLQGQCPVFEAYGRCPSGWKCRFVKSHMKEIEHEDGRKELVLVEDSDKFQPPQFEQLPENPEVGDGNKDEDPEDLRPGVYNVVSKLSKIEMSRKRADFSRSDEYIEWLGHETKVNAEIHSRKDQSVEPSEEMRARYTEPPFKPSEKRRLYFGPETPTLAPLTTQGNLPFRRLCVELGAQLTYSEMVMGLPMLQGTKSDWTLMKAHESEIRPPRVNSTRTSLIPNYDVSRDLRFGAQISGGAHWVTTKVAEALNRFCPHLRLIDLNCGCPIDMVFKSGGGSALLESHGKLERMIRGMNAVSGEIPITAKIRTGIKSSRPTAQKVIQNLAFGGKEHRERLGAPGCAAITLHGRSREQRYTKRADWGYIGECAALIKTYNDQRDALTDTIGEADPSTLPNNKDGRIFFLGNGDCYSHVDYFDNIKNAQTDSVMIGRGALIKPWIFEEIEKGQYLDKSASERLGYVEKFVRYGLEAWGSDELGIGFTRRFLLEWLSFTHRYVPIGVLEYLPPNMNDRPPAYKGRNDMETMLASTNYLDWIKITEMYLGPVHPGFKFQPKHKSNAYEAEG